MIDSAKDDGTAALLEAFDRLYSRAAAKLNTECTDEERDQARRSFATRFREAIRVVEKAGMARVPDEVLHEMETAIDTLSPGNIAGYLAISPLALHLQEVMHTLTIKAAEQRVLEHLINQADDAYGGN